MNTYNFCLLITLISLPSASLYPSNWAKERRAKMQEAKAERTRKAEEQRRVKEEERRAQEEKTLRKLYEDTSKLFEPIIKELQLLTEAKPTEHAYYLTQLKLAFHNAIESSPKDEFWALSYELATHKPPEHSSIDPVIESIGIARFDICSYIQKYANQVDIYRIIIKNTLRILEEPDKELISNKALLEQVNSFSAQLRKLLVLLS